MKEGTKSLKKPQQVRQSHLSTRKIRCRCGDYATEVPDGRGGTIFRCQGCQAQFKFQAM